MNILPINFSDEFLTIRPILREDVEKLANIAINQEIFTHYPINIDKTKDSITRFIESTIKYHENGSRIVHTILTPNGEFVGQSSYMNIRPKDKSVEIGATWYAPKFWGTKINMAAKLALLDNAFNCGAVRVEIKTDSENKRSQAAIAKIGAKYEGTLRKHMLKENGKWRDTVYFSIIDDEWPEVKQNLIARLQSL